MTDPATPRFNGLILPGGGARAAYQVGVLRALAESLPPSVKAPFPVISGVSAGAINAAKLATHGEDFREGVARLADLWGNLKVDRVYRTDLGTVLGDTLRWASGLARGLDKAGVRSILNNQPLRKLLEKELDFDAVQRAIDAGSLRGLAITAAGFTSAESVTYFQAAADCEGWRRTRREGKP
ncbi:MAG TPA: patatin-like phospholipase family protein, partial [Holophagaceae bacterium]|nr:patatin-like phospholipase family protein [Holophagaceae bacterium]